jgi:hypothetical protein
LLTKKNGIVNNQSNANGYWISRTILENW